MSKSSYPEVIDSDLELPRVDNNITEIGGDAINSLRDAIFAIERSIGINPQGNASDLVSRLNKAIDSDGNIKSSALSKVGLVTLPISDKHIADNAGVLESKINLDFTTSFLNNRISSNLTDINTIRTSLASVSSQAVSHFNGSQDRHDGYDIDLVSPIRSFSDIESALHTINNAFSSHEQSVSVVHAASAISVNNEFNNFGAPDVQSALVELDALSTNVSAEHQDNLHQNGIGLNERGEQGDQGNLKNTTLAPTIFQTDISKATHILQVMRPNVARITSKNTDFRALKVGEANVLRIQANGINRGALDVNFSSIIPSSTESVLTANEITLDQVVETINSTAHSDSNHYPVSAYNTNGKLTIAHNIPGNEFSIQIRDDVQFSAHAALGFGDVALTTFSWSNDNHAAYVGGNKVTKLKSLVKIKHSHTTSPLDTLNLGIGDLSELGLSIGNEGRVIVNITNHSTTPSDNGTYYIINYPDNKTITLNRDVQNGEFDLEIAADSVNFDNTAKGEIFDIFLENDEDGYGKITKTKRLSYNPISGVTPRSISNDFTTDDIEWQVDTDLNIIFHDNNGSGESVSIPSSSFRGQLKVKAPDNKSTAVFEVHGVPSTGRKTFDVLSSDIQASKMQIGSVHYGGNFSPGQPELRFVTDKRLQGASLDNSNEDRLNLVPLEEAFSHLRNNGVIDGLDVISSDQTSFKIRGGKALVDGRVIDVETQTLAVQNLSAAKRLLLLDKSGQFVMKHEFDSGFTFNELISGDSYGDNRGLVPIVEFETDGAQIDGYFLDRRLSVNKLDKRVLDLQNDLNSRIDQVAASSSGSAWGFTEASLSIAGDGYIAVIEPASNRDLTYIPSGATGDTNETDARGFTAGNNPSISTRVFEFSSAGVIKTSVFKAIGMTHINVFAEFDYTGVDGGPFGTSDEAHIELGISVDTGISTITESDEYARVKTIDGVLSSDSVIERYVVSIPINQLHVKDNWLFDFVPRVRIINSTVIDGGTSSDKEPTIRIDNMRIVTSSYSVAGNLLEEDGTSKPLAATIGDIL